ncbi:hypothetical protein GYMLUDRAFT_54638 [Collybiopsis luxurians FD-317 M1]|nr:hypothetical protein GYMLUDRAFT_54638 [Collybiopsis luxurians FD-317 M1]
MYEREKLLIANRGEIAVRIIRTAREIGLATIAIYTPSDALAPHVSLADEAVSLSIQTGQSEFDAYCSGQVILSICYGFLSENAEFAKMVIDNGIIWLGPRPDIIRNMGIKHEARRMASLAGVAVVPGSQGLVQNVNEALDVARRVGFPVMLKATAGGGGMGLVALFQNSGLFIERYIPAAHHIEIQVFGDGRGTVVHLGERECSIQRRHQKVIEESPSPLCVAHPELKSSLIKDAVILCQSIKYSSAGTVEFIVDDQSLEHYFLEVNTRIQASIFGVTEARYHNLDIVKMMINYGLAQRRDNLDAFSQILKQDLMDTKLLDLHAVEVRVYAENPHEDFKPCPGILQYVNFPESDWLRIESWARTVITPFFDPLLCKVVVTGSNRKHALDRMLTSLAMVKIQGPPNNISYLSDIILEQDFQKGKTITAFLRNFHHVPQAFTVLSSGLEATVQDLPGRHVGLGVPISGPMDAVSFRLANILVGNNPEIEGLEVIIVPGMEFTLQFHTRAIVAVTGKDIAVEVNNKICNMWSAIEVPESGILRMDIKNAGTSGGLRNYIAIGGGFPDIPKYLGSKSSSLNIGGYQGRALKVGDQITIKEYQGFHQSHLSLPKYLIPHYPTHWTIYVLNGPQNDLEYVSTAEQVFNTIWKVSASSNRMGIRLEGPDKISWARTNGGDGGSHPSNILDNAYALGTLNINGDTPVILTNEGPDMGGYVCLCTVTSGNMHVFYLLFHILQLNVQFSVTWDSARKLSTQWREWFQKIEGVLNSGHNLEMMSSWPSLTLEDRIGYLNPVLFKTPTSVNFPSRPQVTFRQAGDTTILVEYGPMCLDLTMRARIHAFELECHFDSTNITQKDALSALMVAENALPDSIVDWDFPGRRFTFPVVVNDRWSLDATMQYMKSSRKEAVYLPSNIEYLARNNGLTNSETVVQKLVESDHIDPRCRLVGQKMNPSRTYTPRGAVGIAGVVSAIYPVESPGGYQLYGRTLPAWQTWGRGRDFAPDRPWILQPFDQIHFEVIEEKEYEQDEFSHLNGVHSQLEQDFDAGQYAFKIEDCIFSMRDYIKFIDSIAHELALFKKHQAAGVLDQEQKEQKLLEDWLKEQRKTVKNSKVDRPPSDIGFVPLAAPISAMVWKILVHPGMTIQNEDEVLIILEAMKTEIPIKAGRLHVGLVFERFGSGVREGGTVQSGDTLLLFKK